MDYLFLSSQKIKTILLVKKLGSEKLSGTEPAGEQWPRIQAQVFVEVLRHTPVTRVCTASCIRSHPVLAVSPLSRVPQQVPWAPVWAITPEGQWGITNQHRWSAENPLGGSRGHGWGCLQADEILLCRHQIKQVFQDSLISDTLGHPLSDDACMMGQMMCPDVQSANYETGCLRKNGDSRKRSLK